MKNKKSIIYLAIFMCIAITYIVTFVMARHNTRMTRVMYYDIGETVIYAGVQYFFVSDICDVDELIQKFELEEHRGEIEAKNNESPALYVVTKVYAKKIEEIPLDSQIRDSLIIINHYADGAGKNYELQDLIQNESYHKVQELEIGEETEYYILNIIAKSNYCKKIWKHMKEAVFYLEMPDYESREYITRIKVIDGKYGDFEKE